MEKESELYQCLIKFGERLGSIETTLNSINGRLDKGSNQKDTINSNVSDLKSKISALEAKQGIMLWVMGSIGMAVISQFFVLFGGKG